MLLQFQNWEASIKSKLYIKHQLIFIKCQYTIIKSYRYYSLFLLNSSQDVETGYFLLFFLIFKANLNYIQETPFTIDR